MSQTSDLIRKTFAEGDAVRDTGLITPAEIVRCDDILYGEDPVWQVLDLYRPRNAAGTNLPVIVSVHGGGWVYGDKKNYQFYCMNLALKGFAVINFSYRLAPENKFPAPLEDTNLVFQWVINHSEEYCLDIDQLFGIGDSAGAHILSLYAAICTNPEYAKQYTFQVPAQVKLKAIVLNCGLYQMKFDGEADLTQLLMQDFLPNRGNLEEAYKISTVNFVTNEYPPVYMMTAVEDFLKDQTLTLARTLMEHDIPFVLQLFGNQKNRLGHVFHLNIRNWYAEQCTDEEVRFIRLMRDKGEQDL